MYSYSGFRIERRKSERIKVNLSTLYTIEAPENVQSYYQDKEFESKTVDLSETGVALLIDQEIPLECLICIKFIMYETDKEGTINFYELLTLLGEVRVINQTSSGKYRVGIEFEEVGQEHRRKLFKLAQTTADPQAEKREHLLLVTAA